MSDKPVDIARADALAARERLVDTLGELQQRFSPGHLAAEAWKEARGLIDDVTDDAARIAMKRPGLAIAIAGIAMVAVARGPLWDMLKSGILKRHATRREMAGLSDTEEDSTQ
ncbi:DUF3618 domain-containing protein [Flavisphingomonas formosensis]|uniref:DUF3618 domain-containing protein n=1 Tax=Flavisphingomonas formosensis TaxID=861534 RepID=UPI0012FC4639|nr:DUF3618 domain-containing protein [Sphingomonas formosensis]